MKTLERTTAWLVAEVDTGEGLGERLPLRTRVHNLEGVEAAKSAAESALSAIRSELHAKEAANGQRVALYLTGLNILVAIALGLLAVFR